MTQPSGQAPRFPKQADIPGSELSSGCAELVVPGDGFVVRLAGLEAAVEDADPAVGELSKGGLVAEVPGPEGVVDLGEIAMGAARAGIVGLPPYGP